MSKYETALEVKKKNEALIKDFTNQIYVPQDRDKTGMNFVFHSYNPEDKWSEITLKVGLHHGWYGSSSCSSDSSEAAGRELAITLNELKSEIISRTINRLNQEIANAAIEARKEAEEVVNLTRNL